MNILLRAAGTALIAALVGCAVAPLEHPPAPPEPITLTAIHEAPGRTAKQLCTAARDWAAAEMPSERQTVEVFDAEAGRLIARGRAPSYFIGGPLMVDFVLRLECRDGRARSQIESLQAWSGGAVISMEPNKILMIRENAEIGLRKVESALAAAIKSPKAVGDW